MNKNQFIEALTKALKEKGFSRNERSDVVADYESMINEALSSGEIETEYIQSLGPIDAIVSTIPMREKTLKNQRDKWVALTPFVATISFFVIGFLLDGFAYAWLVFLLIPMSAIALNTKGISKWVALSPFIFTILFFFLGFAYNLWTVAWVGYTLILPLGILAEDRPLKPLMVGISTLIPAAFVGLFLNDPNPYYALIFLGLIPVIVYQNWPQLKALNIKKLALGVGLTLTLTAIYVGLGLSLGAWHPTWVIFLLIPIGGLLYTRLVEGKKTPLVAYMPFLSVILFIIIGDFFNLYEIAWLVFLLIPITGILTGQDD